MNTAQILTEYEEYTFVFNDIMADDRMVVDRRNRRIFAAVFGVPRN